MCVRTRFHLFHRCVFLRRVNAAVSATECSTESGAACTVLKLVPGTVRIHQLSGARLARDAAAAAAAAMHT